MTPEQRYVVGEVTALSKRLSGAPLALYGVGPNTELILRKVPDLPVRCLLDAATVGRTIYGQPVLTLEQAHELGVRDVVIIARESNVGIIRKRIAADCKRLGMTILDIHGNNLTPLADLAVEDDEYWNLTLSAAKQRVAQADSVSFDVFDTLITRHTLFPTDVFELVEHRSNTPGFAQRRIEVEARLNAFGSPRLDDIYALLEQDPFFDGRDLHGLRELELTIEREALHPRAAMVELFEHALSCGKPITLVSDMYLPTEWIRNVLRDSGVTGFNTLLVSGDVGRSKATGLFDLVAARGHRHLHIGDNAAADGDMARANGFDTLLIRSPLHMLQESRAHALNQRSDSLAGRLHTGLAASRAFNDPFASHLSRSRVPITSPHEMGYVAIGPLVAEFISWLVHQMQERDISLVLLAARDGYLINSLCTWIDDGLRARNRPGLRPFTYIKTSRMAAVLAGITDERTALDAASLAFSGTDEQLLTQRFDLATSDIAPQSFPTREEAVLHHLPLILKRAAQARDSYQRHLEPLKLADHKRVGFFDFVSAGTTQRSLERIIGRPLAGLYFLHLDNRADLSSLDIDALYRVDNAYRSQSRLYLNYIFLENFMSSPEASLKGFSKDGLPVYLTDPRTAEDRERLEVIHEGIREHVQRWCTLLDFRMPCAAGLDSADGLLGLLDSAVGGIPNDLGTNNALADEFCNRSFLWQETLP